LGAGAKICLKNDGGFSGGGDDPASTGSETDCATLMNFAPRRLVET
jgi:hypothetical protein